MEDCGLTVVLDLGECDLSSPEDVAVVEVICQESPTAISQEELLAVLSDFLENEPKASRMTTTLFEIASEFIKTKDQNQYFASYTKILVGSVNFGLSPSEALDILQKFFLCIEALLPQTTKKSSQQPIPLTDEDADILEYIGGFIIRKMYYHSSTSERQKSILGDALKDTVKAGSIAYERNRACSTTDGESMRLWGISGWYLHFLKKAEIYFRKHIANNTSLNINEEYFEGFHSMYNEEHLNKETGFDAATTTTALLEKVFKKFTKIRAYSYAKFYTKNITCKQEKSAHGLRKQLKKRGNHN